VLTSEGKQDANLKHSGPSSPHAQTVADKQHNNHKIQNSLDTGECPAARLTGFLRILWLKLLQQTWKKAESCSSFPLH